MSQCYITNLGAGLVQRSVAEGKPIVFSRVCFNTEYVGKASALFFKPVEWYGENLGIVVGSQSHVSVSGVSCPCNTQLAIQCNDNSKAWKTVSVFAHLEGEENEILFAAQSLMNGTIKHLFLMELPICLEGAFEDFGEVMDADVADAIEGGGGGGGGDVPANMMTTDTEQTGLSGVKSWEKQSFIGKGSAENPEKYDILNVIHAEIGRLEGELVPVRCFNTPQYYDGSRWLSGRDSYAQLSPLGVLQLNSGETVDDEEHVFRGGESLEITPNGVQYENQVPETLSATWNDIINAANSSGGGGGDVPANMMTTNTEQTGLSGTKTWTWNSYEGEGTVDEPQDGDIRTNESISIDCIEGNHVPLALDSNEEQYSYKDGWYAKEGRHLRITSGGVTLNDSFASWSNIINAAKVEQGFDHVSVRENEGVVYINSEQVKPNTDIKIGAYVILVIDSNGQIVSIHAIDGSVLDISAAVYDDNNSNMYRVVGIATDVTFLSFDSPITPAEGQEIYIHWTRYV